LLDFLLAGCAPSEQEADDVMVRLNGLKESAFLIGEVAKCADDEEGVLLV
jgi:phosphoribosylformylglycinamidine cyclo-ligase